MADIVTNELIKAEYQDGVSQVDENLVITTLESSFEADTRTLRTYCKIASKETDEIIEINNVLS